MKTSFLMGEGKRTFYPICPHKKQKENKSADICQILSMYG
jgi:hypothetical protein